MDIKIKIPKRLYDDIAQYCNVNNIDVEKYCSLSLKKQLSLDKYGDLNQKLVPKQEKEETVKVETVESLQVIKPEIPLKNEVEVKIPEEFPKKDTEQPEKRKHRTIETK